MRPMFDTVEREAMERSATVRVWDPLVRVLHWALALAFTIAFLSGDELLGVHTLAGYAALAIVLVRLPWGLIGTRHARFTDFVRPPREALRYLRDLLRGRAARHLGHNPAGGLMIVALLVAIPLMALTGMATLAVEEGAGPLAGLLATSPHWLAEALEETHEVLANLLLVLVLLHIGGVLVESLLHRENLVRAMFTGNKPARGEPGEL